MNPFGRPASSIACAGILVIFGAGAWIATRKAPAPDFGPNVLVFDPAMDPAEIQRRCDAVFAAQEKNEFGPGRRALLFKPGRYAVDVNTGFYTHVAGLGKLPDDVVITGAVRSEGDWDHGHVTRNFWRACENLAIAPATGANRWGVSQAAPLRRVHVRGSLVLDDAGWASGGFMADSKIDETVRSGAQQQWFSRNTEWGSWSGGLWNMFFLGTVNPPDGTWPDKPYTTIDRTPVIREKPFLCVNETGEYEVFVPGLRKESLGCSWTGGKTEGASIPIGDFYIAREGKDTAATLNSALSKGKHLLLTPGIYPLKTSLRIIRPGTVVLGLGLATLLPENGTAAMEIADVGGVQVAGLLFDAGPRESPVLLQVGDSGSSKGHFADPVFLHDVFCRVGGAAAGAAACGVKINSRDVVGDNLWIWRADHGPAAGWEMNPGKNGLIVNGRDVTFYGLFVEHFQEYQTVWNGNGGRVYFYQCEMPYDPPAPGQWRHDGTSGWAGYKVADTVASHEAWGMGVYCTFRKPAIVADMAFEVPQAPGVRFHNLLSFRLSGGTGDSLIRSVINGTGGPVTEQRKKALVLEYPLLGTNTSKPGFIPLSYALRQEPGSPDPDLQFIMRGSFSHSWSGSEKVSTSRRFSPLLLF
jgi:hypothetical protein